MAQIKRKALYFVNEVRFELSPFPGQNFQRLVDEQMNAQEECEEARTLN
jgi:hypothetical protein